MQFEFGIHESIPRSKSGYLNAFSAAGRIVSFDFGPPIGHDLKTVNSVSVAINNQREMNETQIHPIYLLQDDGDIFVAVANLKAKLR